MPRALYGAGNPRSRVRRTSCAKSLAGPSAAPRAVTRAISLSASLGNGSPMTMSSRGAMASGKTADAETSSKGCHLARQAGRCEGGAEGNVRVLQGRQSPLAVDVRDGRNDQRERWRLKDRGVQRDPYQRLAPNSNPQLGAYWLAFDQREIEQAPGELIQQVCGVVSCHRQRDARVAAREGSQNGGQVGLTSRFVR